MIFDRANANQFAQDLSQPYVQILLGARQTGKSSFLKSTIKNPDLFLNFADPFVREQFLQDKNRFTAVCRGMSETNRTVTIVVDEAQEVPSVFDSVQLLYDEDKTRCKFILCGSSARKLRKSSTNLLPGRCLLHSLHPLMKSEFGTLGAKLLPEIEALPRNHFPEVSLEDRLLFGDLPGVVTADMQAKENLLRSYSVIYLQEEIRREALAKDWNVFAKFLRLAARESGGILNYSNLSKDVGLSVQTIKNYYNLLEEMFVGFSIPAYTNNSRALSQSSHRFLFFDLGVRNTTAELSISKEMVGSSMGSLFEQFIGLELHRRLKYLRRGALYHFRSATGIEVDYVIELDGEIIAIEVKSTDTPRARDYKNLKNFLSKVNGRGYVVCQTKYFEQLDHNIKAVPWTAI